MQRKEKSDLFDNNIHAPLIFINPSLKPDQRIDSLVQVIDIFPTALSFAGVGISAIVQGKDLKPTVLDRAPGFHRYIYSNYAGGNDIQSAVRSKEWKFIYNEKADRAQLYNLIRDPQELNNLSSVLPEKVDFFLKEYYGWKEKILKFELSAEEKRLSRDETEQLRALGYID